MSPPKSFFFVVPVVAVDAAVIVVVVVVGEHTEGTTQHKPSSRHAMHLRGRKSILYAP